MTAVPMQAKSDERKWPEDLIERMSARIMPAGSSADCRIIALSGAPGSGKTTLAGQLCRRLESAGLRIATLSLDDFYLPVSARRQLARTIHPWLALRGVPGTHDLPEILRVLDRLTSGRPSRWSGFDKARDESLANARGWTGGRPDAIIMEGWCLGCRPLGRAGMMIDHAPEWRLYVNAAIESYRKYLFPRFHRLWFLRAPDWPTVRAWRFEQELARRVPLRRLSRIEVNRLLAPMMPVVLDMLHRPPAGATVIGLDRRRRVLD